MEISSSKKVIDTLKNRLGPGELIILESQMKDHPSSRKSYLAAKPLSSVRAYGNKIVRWENGTTKVSRMNPWDALKKYQSEKKNWLFGYLGYDLKNYLENVHSINRPLIRVPDFYFMEPSVLVQADGEKVTYLSGEESDLSVEVPEDLSGSVLNLRPEITKAEYMESIEWIQDKIKEGEFYELNFSFPFSGTLQGDPYWLYEKMREINPVPFGGFIRLEDVAVCCASPERFLKKTGSRIISEPIKGTSPRSGQPDTDRYNRKLLLNEKNRAENLMIVDLVRHDFSKIALPGSVHVPELFKIQSFGTVHQLMSAVQGQTKEGMHPVDVIRACFPMGSMTGAPKIRVMEAIDEIENYKRGIYSGAIGYFSPEGDFDFNVVIRSAMVQDQKLIYPVGGAITSDSVAAEEWEETEVKSRNLTRVFSTGYSLSK